MKTLLILVLVGLSARAMALSCNVIVYTEKEVLEKSFEAPLKSLGHGAPEITVKGLENEVIAMADGKWLGISWKNNDVLIAESVNLIRDMVHQPRVLIMYNPKNTDEQVSINCE